MRNLFPVAVGSVPGSPLAGRMPGALGSDGDRVQVLLPGCWRVGQTGFEVGRADVGWRWNVCVWRIWFVDGGRLGRSSSFPRTRCWSDERVECGESSGSIQLLLDRDDEASGSVALLRDSSVCLCPAIAVAMMMDHLLGAGRESPALSSVRFRVSSMISDQ